MKYLIHRFIEHIPENLEDGILYISIEHSVAIHNALADVVKKLLRQFLQMAGNLFLMEKLFL